MTRLRSHDIEFDPSTATLHRPQGSQPLRRQVAETLHLLMQRAPALVSVDELLDAVWGRHEISPSAVPQAIRELRRALGDQAQDPTYIETRHKLGYRWLPPVQPAEAPEALPPAQTELRPIADAVQPETVPAHPSGTAVPPLWPRRARFLIGSALLLTALILGWYSRGLWPLRQATDSTLDEASLDADFARNDRLPWSQGLAAIQTLDLTAAEQALANVPDNDLAADLLRARLAGLKADGPALLDAIQAARSKLNAVGQAGRLRAEAVFAHLQGQDSRAWQSLAPLLALRPNDIDLHLFAWELRKRIPREALGQLAERLQHTEVLSPAHQQWLAIQIAGVRQQPEQRQVLAQAWLQQHASAHPGMAAAVRIELAEALESLRQPADARALALQASAEAAQLGLHRLAVRAMRTAVWNAMSQGQNAVAEADLADMQRLLQGRDDPTGVVLMRHYRAMLFNRRGDSAKAIEAFTNLARDYEAMGELGSAATALNATVSPLYLLGRAEEVPDVITRALALATRAGDRNTIGFLHGSLGNHYVRAGDLEQGQMNITLALAQFREIGDQPAQATALGNLGQIAQMRGRLEEAQSFNEQAVALEQALGDPHGLAYARKRLMDIALARGDLAEAEQSGMAALQGFQSYGDQKETALTARLLGELALRQANLAKARELLLQIESISPRSPLIDADTHCLRAQIASYRGEFAAAAQDFSAAAKLWQDAEELSDAVLARLAALRARAVSDAPVAIEEELRQLMQAPERNTSAGIDLQARLLLVEVLIRGRNPAAATALSELDAALRQTPDAETSLRATLLRAQTDPDPASRRQRRQWVQQQAQDKGLQLLALEAAGQLAQDAGGAEPARWQAIVRERDALGLLMSRSD